MYVYMYIYIYIYIYKQLHVYVYIYICIRIYIYIYIYIHIDFEQMDSGISYPLFQCSSLFHWWPWIRACKLMRAVRRKQATRPGPLDLTASADA